jgi:hypothetical protein
MRRSIPLAVVVFLFAAAPAPAAVLGGPISYGCGGGFDGSTTHIQIHSTGRGKIDGGSPFKLTATEGRALRAAIKKADLAHVKSPKPTNGADIPGCGITYKGRSVDWDAMNGRSLPAAFHALARRLQRLYDKYS